ncbi:5'-methylthioadenosine/S-adenosylhomocysteine nucleosidase family protein [Actinoallomurus acaciae]|uniref:Phosphorylase n=1 Tax=Actinoallomurus acaciae TaxID=502577 RepID=A0ABV5YAH0_9ACTN
MNNSVEVPTVVILTAIDLEYEAVRKHLRDVRTHTHPAGTLFEVGDVAGITGRVALAAMGEGNTGAAAIAERSIALFQPRLLLFVGIAGALKDDIRLGDVVVPTRVYGYHGGREDSLGFRARPRSYEAPHALLQRAQFVNRRGDWTPEGADPLDGPRCHFKPIAAGEVLLDSRSSPLARRLKDHYNDAAAVEMESAGVAIAGHLNQSLPVLIVRGISDHADGSKGVTDKKGSQDTAARHAAAFAFALIRDLDD